MDALIAFSSAVPINNNERPRWTGRFFFIICISILSRGHPSTYRTRHLCRSCSSCSPLGVPEMIRPHWKHVICHIAPSLSKYVLKADDLDWQYWQSTLSNDCSIPEPRFLVSCLFLSISLICQKKQTAQRRVEAWMANWRNVFLKGKTVQYSNGAEEYLLG